MSLDPFIFVLVLWSVVHHPKLFAHPPLSTAFMVSEERNEGKKVEVVSVLDSLLIFSSRLDLGHYSAAAFLPSWY